MGNRYMRDIPLPGFEESVPEGYRAPDVAKIIGITYRKLDHWTTTGLVTPSVRDAKGSGTQRLYSFQDIVYLKMIRRLRDTGVSLQRIRKAIAFVRDKGVPLNELKLATDSTGGVYAILDNADLADLLQSGQGVLFINVGSLTKEVDNEVAVLTPERAYEQGSTDNDEGQGFQRPAM